MKNPAFYNKRASEVLAIIGPEIMKRFLFLKERQIAKEIWLFGSIARGSDTQHSDIDLMLQVDEASFRTMGIVEEKLCDWVDFPVHILLSDGANYIPEIIFKERIRLCDWTGMAPRNF